VFLTASSVAVSPDSQGKELASKLIKPFLAQADEQSMSVYTETTVPFNVGLYEHFEFECKDKAAIKGTGISVAALYRPAFAGSLDGAGIRHVADVGGK
jgi:N-acetylglutamate synthase-like GNAT family acetyltransferase